MTVSCGSSMCGARAAMRPSFTDTSPSTMSKRSFIVMMRPLRISRDKGFGLELWLLGFQAWRCPLHRELARIACRELAVFDGNDLGQDGDGNFLRRDCADIETNGRMDVFETVGRHVAGPERFEDAGDLRAAADEAQITQFA